MSVDKKIIERAEKLARLASPASNTTISERQNAALEVCKMISEHDLVIRPREQKRKTRRSAPIVRQPSNPWSVQQVPPGWARSVATRDGVCADPDCGGTIFRGDRVWAKITGFDVTYLHIGEDCGW